MEIIKTESCCLFWFWYELQESRFLRTSTLMSFSSSASKKSRVTGSWNLAVCWEMTAISLWLKLKLQTLVTDLIFFLFTLHCLEQGTHPINTYVLVFTLCVIVIYRRRMQIRRSTRVTLSHVLTDFIVHPEWLRLCSIRWINLVSLGWPTNGWRLGWSSTYPLGSMAK